MTLVTALATLAACRERVPSDRVRISGYVEATEVRVAAEVSGRLIEMRASEGDRLRAGDLIARLDASDAALAVERARADRRQADAQLRLLAAGSRGEDIRQAEAQAQAAEADLAAARAELKAAEQDLERFESLLRSNSGSRKQRDDAATRRDVARERVRGAMERARSGRAALARLRSGARPQELEAASARLAAADAQLALLDKNLADATITAPVSGTVTEKLADVGELIAQGAPLLVVTDLEHAWVNVFVDGPVVPRLRLRQSATVVTDAAQRLPGTVTFISPKAEFTPRNVQTAEERSKLVYRLKVSVDNRAGILKQGMPVEVEIPFSTPRDSGTQP